ncbi:hypothetical protein LMG19282_00572 [Cupriavidus campinensis]|uniref:DUF342 domain-containing protein n=1 Tax=Cupriavidus campinensis TaxID=151783 RepID=A0AAE9I4A3_9BURK|nr:MULTISPECIES: FapA family protein [Cupriavidus]TSP10251.1 DUF342 domain-containing protein [Cupriavidus campinensis]URF05035.1 FapA family protein [Cupriavidus campinensis]CAG2132243.1 hypothetical protein LMG19282_00572 [Cupriavidus campinensis]
MTTDAGLRLELSQPGDHVRACFTPEPGRLPPDRATLEASLEEHGWRGARLDQSAVNAFLTQCQLADGEVDGVIGSLLDGAFELEITADKLSLLLTLMPPEGGRAIDIEDIAAAATSMGVVALLDKAAIEVALEAGSCEGREIARGVAPVQGQAARFDSLVQPRKPAQSESEDDRFDLRDLGSLLLVNPGTALMRRTPAKAGQDGMDILGKPIPAEPMVDTPFAADLTGVAIDPNDPLLLLAVIAGSPRVLPSGVIVSPVVDVEAVDLHSGNVTFDGSLRVSGDIRTGMSVRVTGDVVVSGTIEAAHVEAGGDVIVKGGIIGKAETAHGADSGEIASVRSKGAVHARYIQNAIVEAATEVVVESGIRQSDVSAGERVTVGSPTGQGSISGGRTRALASVSTAMLGAPAGTATTVQVGLNPFADQQKAELEEQRRKILEEQAKLQQLAAFFAKHPERAVGDIREKARATMYKINRDLFELDAEIARLAEQMKPSEEAVIAVGRRIHGGVTMQVGHKILKVMEDKTGGQVRVVDDRISVT